MEKIDIRECFPIMNGGDGVILSKRGDICVGWELTLPPAFRCNEERYDSLLNTLFGAIQLLPDWTVVHKQDVYMKKQYKAEDPGDAASDFLQEACKRHFEGREYLDHKCCLWLTFSSRKNIKGGGGWISGFGSPALPKRIDIIQRLAAADQFAAMVAGNGLWTLKKLSESDIFGEIAGQADKDVGILQDYLNFTDEGDDVLSDMALAPDRIRTGEKEIVCHLFADLDQLPGEVASCRRVTELSTEHSVVALSYLHEIGQHLPCEHVVNTFLVKEPLKDIHGAMDQRRRQMQSMSLRNAGNRKYSEELNAYLETAAVEQMSTVKYHINVLSTDADMVTTAISKLGITPVRDISNAPSQFWASIPGNEGALAYSELMTMELLSALCLGIYDGLDTGMPGGVLTLIDRIRRIPQHFDIQEKAMALGHIENYNVFLLGPSGSGKSFFMNKYLHCCWLAGEHCFLIDQGDSYRALCHIIREESGGRDGTYYVFEKKKPISFNPFRNVKRFSRADSQAMTFLFTLMVTLWKNGKADISSSAERYVRESLTAFIKNWKASNRDYEEEYDPVFNDYFEFVRDVFSAVLEADGVGKEYFDLKDYLISLEQFYKGGPYDYLLNSELSENILEDRFVVFEIDHIKGDPVIYPITTLVIMDAFMEKMTCVPDFKVMCIEEAWKAIMGTQMATYMLELWKTARKHRTAAMVVTQELKDITSSPIIKDSIIENSGVKILLDQTKYLNRFEELARELSLSEDDKAMVLSLNRYKVPGQPRRNAGREIFFNLGNKKSFVMRLEVSPEERIAFSSAKVDKLRLAKAVEKCGGSYIKAIKKMVKS